MSFQPLSFSVVVPTCGRPLALRACLSALCRLDYPRTCFEVIVVDDGGKVPADKVVDEFRRSIDIALLRQANGGPAAARNAGAEQASREFLAFTDDDCRPNAGWLAAFAGRLAMTPRHVLGGKVVNGSRDNRFSATSQMILDVVYRHYNADPERARFFGSANVAMAASVFRDVGGFNTRFRIASEDREFCDRCRFQGCPMAFVADAVVSHDHEMTFIEFCRQHFNYDRGACDFHEIRAERGSGTIQAEITFHLNLRNWLLYPLAQVGWREALPLAANLALWQLSYAGGFLGESLLRKLGRQG